MASPFYVASIIGLFVGAGTLTSIVLNVTFKTEVKGRDGEQKEFKKPWCAMLLMCLAMSSTLLKWWFDRRRSARTLDDSGSNMKTVAFKITIPAFLSVFGTFLQAAGLMWTPVSVYQMLQSSIIIFSAIIRFLWLGKGLARFESCGIVLTAIGLSGVGVASVVSGGGDGGQTVSMGAQITGIAMVLVSQAIMALEGVIEERLLHGYSAAPEFVCGMVGAWGILFCALIFLPIAQFLPGEEGNGLREDSIETAIMIKENTNIQLTLVLLFIVVFVYNHTMRLLIHVTQATTMQVLGGMRTLCVWAVALLMYFVWPEYGEKWKWSTWIELAGFLILMFGVFLYRATFKLSCFEYPAAVTHKGSSVTDATSLVSSQNQAEGA